MPRVQQKKFDMHNWDLSILNFHYVIMHLLFILFDAFYYSYSCFFVFFFLFCDLVKVDVVCSKVNAYNYHCHHTYNT